MKEVAEMLVAFMAGNPEFTNVFGDRLFALTADGSTGWPFALYRIYEESGKTKDADDYDVTMSLHFKPGQYTQCLEALDALKPIIRRQYNWISSESDINEEDLSYIGIINFKINH